MSDPARRRRPGGHPFGLSHPVHLRARMRQVQAVRLHLAGCTLREIAEALGYAGRQGAHEALRSARSRASPGLRIEQAALDLARLDRLLVAALPQALAGRLAANRLCAAIVEARQNLVRTLETARAQLSREWNMAVPG